MDKDSKLCPIFRNVIHSWEHDGHALPGCLHSSPKGTECVLYANHTGSCSWIPKEPLTKINPANEQEKDFWVSCFLQLMATATTETIEELAQFADLSLQEYRKRLAHP